jgi:hypothetical protein
MTILAHKLGWERRWGGALDSTAFRARIEADCRSMGGMVSADSPTMGIEMELFQSEPWLREPLAARPFLDALSPVPG